MLQVRARTTTTRVAPASSVLQSKEAALHNWTLRMHVCDRLLRLTWMGARLRLGFVGGTGFPKVPVGPERTQNCNMSHVYTQYNTVMMYAPPNTIGWPDWYLRKSSRGSSHETSH